jgi:hypothetical protein
MNSLKLGNRLITFVTEPHELDHFRELDVGEMKIKTDFSET